jgi:hypothetical protein
MVFYGSKDAWSVRGKEVSQTIPTNGQVLVYDSDAGKLVYTTLSGGDEDARILALLGV